MFGGHVTISPKPLQAVIEAKKFGFHAIQIFTHNPRGWSFKELNENELEEYREGLKEQEISVVASHCNYLINLATTEEEQFEKSMSCLRKELEYADAFSCDYFVLHVGKHKDAGEDKGIAQVIKGLNGLKKELLAAKTMLLLENVAGQGTEVGRTFEKLNKILTGVDEEIKSRIGICLDTCHTHAAGYDISTPKGVDALVDTLEKTFGVKRIKLIHLNDSKTPCDSRVDRHENIGFGTIGKKGLAAFINNNSFKEIPMILETPEREGRDYTTDLETLNRLKE